MSDTEQFIEALRMKLKIMFLEESPMGQSYLEDLLERAIAATEKELDEPRTT